MEIIIKKSFSKSLKTTPKHIQEATKEIIFKLSASKNLEASGVDFTKMEAQRKGENYYRIRVGDWRIGLEYINPKILLITIISRGTIYKQFPPKK